jgi:DNA-binding IscR family transcriptional regulator
MEGPQALVACATGLLGAAPKPESGGCGCEYQLRCEIRHLMGGLNERVRKFLSDIYLSELAGEAPLAEGQQRDLKGALVG